jgi:uncharacterized protein YegL
MQFKLNDIKKVTLPAVQEEKTEIAHDSASFELFKRDYKNSLRESHKELVFFIDRSGSMRGTEGVMEEYFLNMIKKYKNTCEDIIVTVVLFESNDSVIYYRRPIKEIENLLYFADGGTKLYDTLIPVINRILDDQFNGSVFSFKTLVMILTDGEDTVSTKYKVNDLNNLIESTKKLGWEYILLSEYELNDYIGIDKVGIFNDKDRLKDCFKSIDKAIDSFMKNDSVCDDWNDSLSEKRLLLTNKGDKHD